MTVGPARRRPAFLRRRCRGLSGEGDTCQSYRSDQANEYEQNRVTSLMHRPLLFISTGERSHTPKTASIIIPFQPAFAPKFWRAMRPGVVGADLGRPDA